MWTYRALAWTGLFLLMVLGGAVLSLRYWILPDIDQYRGDIVRLINQNTKQKITIGRISGNWDGIRPQLILDQVAVLDRAGQPALELKRVDGTLSWRSLAILRLNFHSLDILGPAVKVKRDKRGVISIAGIEIEQTQQDDGSMMDLLLEQRDIEVRNAYIVWHDELTGAPPLELKDVNLQVVNSWNRHRFGLRAVPPAALASPLDVRGDLSGSTVKALDRWNGRMFVEVDYVDIAAWRQWVPFPVEFPRGTGALRAWFTFGDHELKELTADVVLAGVRTRLAKELPELELPSLSGRVGWKALGGGFEVSTRQLGLTTSDGLVLRPTDFLLRTQSERSGQQQRGELRSNALDLAPLVALADRLPLEDEVRRKLVELAPKGDIRDVAVRWTGAWPEPTHYSARGRFEGLSLTRAGRIPGFSGVSGNIDGNEKSGTLTVNAGQAVLDMPLVFKERIEFDTLTAQLSWARAKGGTEFRLSNVSFANPHLSGTVFGSYRAVTGGPGDIDVTGTLTRADLRQTARYIPVTIAKSSRPWLERAFVAGSSNEVRFQAKGNVADFPFPDNKGGSFSVTGKVSGGVLDYADRWPRIEGIEGEVSFRGKRMDVVARQATMSGVRLSKVRADIPDLNPQSEEILTVSGEAEGATSEFLAFINRSPVGEMIDRFTDGMEAQGSGRLSLKLVLPLKQMAQSRVNGSYQMVNNEVRVDASLPPVEQANGRIEFTENTVRLPSATGVFLGGPIAISGSSQRDATVRIGMQGKIDADNVRRAGGPVWMRNLRGTTEWRGSFTLRKKLADLVVESNLQGIASNLPAPFSKTASESVPLRIERLYTGRNRDTWNLAYGNLVSAQFVRRDDGRRSVLERGVVRLGGGSPAELDRNGLWITGSLKQFDLDDWLRFAGGGGNGFDYTIGGVDVRLGELDVFDRKFHDVSVVANPQGSALQVALSAREGEGAANWRPQGTGRLVARFKRFSLPAQEPRKAPAEEKQAESGKPPEFPALDVVIEQFQLAEKQLGKLELIASPVDRDWRIEKLRISNPDGALNVDGVWQSWLAQPRTQVNVRVDVADVGRMLTRFGHAEGVRRGNAKIEGTLAWSGSPHQFDYPTLTGNIVVESAKGQFLKLEPGIGKLLGILSLQSLPRRISLDFRDIFSDGFAYDEIIGAVTVNRGVATTQNLRITGPSARIVMGGEVDLARETQKLRVRVTPFISDGFSIAGALIGGPLAGVATFLAQKILKDPLNELVSYEYAVTGSWSDPQVARFDATAAAEKTP